VKTDARQGILANVMVGILGAFLGEQLLGRGSINAGMISIRSIFVSLFGAIVLLGPLNLIRRCRVR